MNFKRPRRLWLSCIGVICALGLVTFGSTLPGLAGTTDHRAPHHGHHGRGDHQAAVSIVPDATTITPTQTLGYTVTVAASRSREPQQVSLEDHLPAGGDLMWAVDDQTRISKCAVTGAVGAQVLSCPTVRIGAGESYSLHIYSHTWDSTSPEVTDAVEALTSHSPARGRHHLLSTAKATIAVTSPSCVNSSPDPTRQLLFNDDFSGTSIDTSKWNVGQLPFPGYMGSTHYHNTQYGSYIVPQDSFVKDGQLNLTTNDVPVTHPDVPAIGTIPYTEGMINSKGKFSTTGGYFEICGKFPAGKGLWPAFWLGAENGNWPPEIDVAEWFGGLEAMQIGQPWAVGPAPTYATAGNQWLSTWRYSNAPTTGYHTYAVWWSPGSTGSYGPSNGGGTMKYYIDGQMVHEIDGSTADLIPDSPMYMILNSGVWAGSTRGGPPDATTVFPNAFRTAWVRVYKAPPPENTDYTAP